MKEIRTSPFPNITCPVLVFDLVISEAHILYRVFNIEGYIRLIKEGATRRPEAFLEVIRKQQLPDLFSRMGLLQHGV